MPGVIDDARHTSKNATVKNFTSTDFLGPIKFDSPNGGTSNSRIKKNVNSPFNVSFGVNYLEVLVELVDGGGREEEVGHPVGKIRLISSLSGITNV